MSMEEINHPSTIANNNFTAKPVVKSVGEANKTESNISYEPKLASIIFRYAALTLDELIISVVFIPLLVVIVFVFYALPELKDNVIINLSLNIFFGLIVGGYFVYFTKTQNTTPGKKYFRIFVKKEIGSSLTWKDVIIREIFGKFVSGLIFSLGYIWAFFDKKKQAWHDKIAGTIVVQTEELSEGRKFVGYLLAFGLVILAILGIIAVLILVALDPAKQLRKAREMQSTTEGRMLNNDQENQPNDSPISEQLTRAHDAGRISGVQQLGRATQAYHNSNQNYPDLSNWSTDLVDSGELGKIPDAIKSEFEPCSINLVNETWCYNVNVSDTIVYAKLDSQQRSSE